MRNSHLIAATLSIFVACAGTSDETQDRRKHRDAGAQTMLDAGSGSAGTDAGSSGIDAGASATDAGSSGIDAGSGSGSGSDGSGSGSVPGGTVSCYRQSAPDAFCTLPTHCCFTNYSAQHNGACGSGACAWGTIDCDGPEDCATGQHCCSTSILDGNGSTVGYRMACTSNACGAPPLGDELCHPNGPACANGGSCVTAYGNQTDLPRSLYICR